MQNKYVSFPKEFQSVKFVIINGIKHINKLYIESEPTEIIYHLSKHQ